MVVNTAASRSSASVRSSSVASAVITPAPAHSSGSLAATSLAAASAMAPGEGIATAGAGEVYSTALSGMSAMQTSMGISTATGPGRPERRAWKARRITVPVWSGRLMNSTCLVTDSHVLAATKLGRTNTMLSGLPPGQHEDGHVVGIRLRETADGILGSGLRLHRHDANALAVAHPRIAIGGHHGAPFVPEGHRPDAFLRHRFDERVGWVARHPLDAFGL